MQVIKEFKIILLVVIMFWGGYNIYRCYNPVIKIGDIWELKSQSPFNTISYKYKILELKNDWVKYECSSGDIDSSTCSSFTRIRTRIYRIPN